MILEGNERGFGAELALHLLNPRDNDHVTVHGISGFVADDLHGAFDEAEMISGATQCQKYLFSLSLNPPPDEKVSITAFENAIAAVEKKLGLTGQPRAIVFHEKLGRRHAHCVWSRIDVGQMKAIKLSHYKRKLVDVSRDLYRIHGWDMPEGFKDHNARDPLNYSREEAGQAKRAKVDPKAMKEMFKRCWAQSDSRAAFAAALWEEGFVLARGERRGFVAVDANGKIWSLSRWCGVKPKELRARLGTEDALWSVEEAISAFASLDGRKPKDQSTKSDAAFEQRRIALVERQRQERTALRDAQETRRLAEVKGRSAQLPKGLKAAWLRMTGQYQAILQRHSEDADATTRKDRTEQQSLIEQHLVERRDLEHSHSQPDLYAEFAAHFAHAADPDPRQKLVLPRDDIPFSRQQLVKNPALILSHISHKQAKFKRVDVLRELAKRLPDPMALKVAADTAMASPELIPHGEGEDFTTRDYVEAETSLRASTTALSKRQGAAVTDARIRSAIQHQDAEMQRSFGGQLSDEQRAALHHLLGVDQLSVVVGLAGSGKSTLLQTANAAWTQQGIKVHGAALAGKAAEGLQSASGIASRTLASLEASWKNGYDPIARGDVLVVDEAGMIGTRQLARVAVKLQSIGAKLVLVGDPDQLQPIEAGTPFRTLVAAHGAAHLTEIHRQHEEWQRQASRDLAAGEIAKAVERYDHHGAVQHRFSRDAALATLVEDYMTDMEFNGPDCSRLAFAHRRKDVYALNQGIRAALRSSGDAAPEVLLETETGPRAFAVGDRLVFTRNDRAMGVKNGMLSTVVKADDGEMVVELDGENGRPGKVAFNPERYNSIDHGYAVTIHKSQGVTIDRSYVLASRTMDAPLAYVAMTRHRDTLNVYVNGEDQPKWAQASQRHHTHDPHPAQQGPKR